jgi:pantetheine-phosphate adenylyltransferase
MAKAVYAGSFDPPTNGHLYMIREGAQLFDEVVVAVGVNPDKRTTFDLETRLRLLHSVTDNMDNVTIEHFENQFLIRYAARIGARYILRGIRNGQDFSYERTMRHVNGDLESGITTVFLIPPRHLAETSSSFVKGLVGPEGWEEVIRGFVPPEVYSEIVTRFAEA